GLDHVVPLGGAAVFGVAVSHHVDLGARAEVVLLRREHADHGGGGGGPGEGDDGDVVGLGEADPRAVLRVGLLGDHGVLNIVAAVAVALAQVAVAARYAVAGGQRVADAGHGIGVDDGG